MMYSIEKIYRNAKYPFVLMLTSLVIAILLLFMVQEMTDVICELMVYSFFSMMLVFLKNKYNKSKTLNIIITIYSLPLIVIILFIILLFAFFGLGVFMAFTPDKRLSQYKYNYLIDYFPKEIPNGYEDATYYHKYPFLQGGEEIILYLKLDSKRILEYKSNLENKNIERNRKMIDIKSKRYSNTPYENGITDDFELFTIESKCDDSSYCNHGLDKHVVINEETNEIIFYYEKW